MGNYLQGTHFSPPQLCLMFSSHHQIHSPVQSLNEENTQFLPRAHLCLFSATSLLAKLPIDFLTCVFLS